MISDEDFLVRKENKPSELCFFCWRKLLPMVTVRVKAGNF